VEGDTLESLAEVHLGSSPEELALLERARARPASPSRIPPQGHRPSSATDRLGG
jgi:hypothetical protein